MSIPFVYSYFSRKENEKKTGDKCKEDNEIMSGIEILDEIIAEAETVWNMTRGLSKE